MPEKMIIKIKEEPIVMRVTSQGVAGRSGPAGAKGDDGITWELVLTMTDVPDGHCTMHLYKNGVLCTQEMHYAYVQALPYFHGTSFIETPYNTNFSGTYAFDYTNVKTFFVTIYEDSYMEKVICSKVLNFGQTEFQVIPVMSDSPDGTCTISLYKDGILYNKPAYAYVQTLSYSASSYVVSGYCGDFTGTKTFEYTNLRGIFVMVYSDSTRNDVLCGNCVNFGKSATIAVGTVDTGAAGSTTTVTNSGTPLNAVLDFVIPKGDTATVAIGTVQTGASGTSASVVNSGTANDAVLDFVIPRGMDGNGYMGAQYDEPEEGVIFEVTENMLSPMAFEDDAPSDNKEYIRKNGTWEEEKISASYDASNEVLTLTI